MSPFRRAQRAAWCPQTRSDVIDRAAGVVRTRSVRAWARTISSRSDSESPPHTPYGSCTARACARHRSRTRQPPQICLARASRSARAGPRSFSGWKNNALSIPRHAPRICQSQTSVTATGSLRVSATFVIPFGDATPTGAAAPTLEPRRRLFTNGDEKHPPNCQRPHDELCSPRPRVRGSPRSIPDRHPNPAPTAARRRKPTGYS